MRIAELMESSYDSWVRYTQESLQADFEEYKLKEYKKWEHRAQAIGARWPLFEDINQFREALDQAPIVKVDQLGRVRNLTKNNSIREIESMVSSYTYPRDVQRILQGLKNNIPIPLPIILQGNIDKWIMAGNTRQAVSRVVGIEPQALLVDVKE